MYSFLPCLKWVPMKFLSKTAKAESASRAVAALRDQFAGFPVKALVFFASYQYDGAETARLIKEAFPGAVTLGCSSSAEMCRGVIDTGSIAALGFSDEGLEEVAVAVARDISTDPGASDKAIAALEEQIGDTMISLDYRRHFGIVLFDATAQNTEQVVERIGNKTDIIFVGGKASDDFSLRHIRVYLNGEAHADGAVLAVLKPRGGFSLLKTQSVDVTDSSFVATRVDQKESVIFELDGAPAAEKFARAIGVAVADLNDDHFVEYSFGVMAEGDPYIRAVHSVLSDGGLRLFCSVPENQRLFLMRMGDIVSKTAKALAEKRRGLGGVSALIDFDCAHRDLTLDASDERAVYGKLFADMESVGFATFGETYIVNVNQTSVMALFE